MTVLPAVADRNTAGAVTLARLPLQGAIFLRGEYTEAWAYESLPPQDAVAVLAPGARRVILFHVSPWAGVDRERCEASGTGPPPAT